MKHAVLYGAVLSTVILISCHQQPVKPSVSPGVNNYHQDNTGNRAKGIQSVPRVEKGRRIALVIGNAHYKHASKLQSPVNDATDVAEALFNLSFDDVIDSYDASKEEMEQNITRFVSGLQANDMAVFYYSGHGMEINGKNYFIPVEADFNFEVSSAQKLEADAKEKAVLADGVVSGMSKAKSSFIILDACRNNLLPSGKKSMTEKARGIVKSIGGGSTPLAKNVNGEGDIITLYATKDGETAFDGKGRNSLFTKHLLRGLKNPSLTVNQLAQQVTKGVKEESKQEYGEIQKPFVYGSLTEDRCLAADCQGQTTSPSLNTHEDVETPSQLSPPVRHERRDDTVPPPI